MRYAIGIDSGSTTTKAVFMRNGVVEFSKVCLTGVSSETSAVRLIDEIKESHGISGDDIGITVVTGYRTVRPTGGGGLLRRLCHWQGIPGRGYEKGMAIPRCITGSVTGFGCVPLALHWVPVSSFNPN